MPPAEQTSPVKDKDLTPCFSIPDLWTGDGRCIAGMPVCVPFQLEGGMSSVNLTFHSCHSSGNLS